MKPTTLLAGACLVACFATDTVFADPITATRFVPERHGDDVCIDTPLSITFNQPPLRGASGTIRVYRSDDTLVDSVDVAELLSSKPIGGAMAGGNPYLFNYYPVAVIGSAATIYLHRSLDYGQTYYVLIDPGVFTDAEGDPFPGIHRPHTWRFATKASGPPPEATRLIVDGRGDGDFCTVQGAIDFVPTDNTRPVVIDVHRGTYTEIVYVNSHKPFITLRGEDRSASVVQYANNNALNGQVSGLFRAMFGVDASDFVLENITLHNTTPYGGTQAEAFRGYGLRTLLNRVNLSSFQDTLLLQNRAFVTNSYIEGDVDFMWGSGPVFFENCELKALHPGYYTQIRNSQGAHGNVYVNCTLTRGAGVADNTLYLARIDPTVFPYSEVVYINAAMDSHVRSAGWLLNNATCSQAPNIDFAEYHSTDLNGNPVDTTNRLACSRQLTDEEAAQFSDPTFVLGEWVPITLNASPDSLTSGDQVTVNWSAAPGHAAADRVALYRPDAPDSEYISAQTVGTDATTGNLYFTVSGHGRYELRYFSADGLTSAAKSNTIRVSRR